MCVNALGDEVSRSWFPCRPHRHPVRCDYKRPGERCPAEHHKRIRHSNFIERTFGETRHLTKVIGRLPRETSCLTLLWAVLDRASRGWRGVNTTPDGLRLLHDLRRCLLESPPQIHPCTPATDSAAENVGATA